MSIINSVNIHDEQMKVLRRWATTQGKTVEEIVREIIRPACVFFIEGELSRIAEERERLEGGRDAGQ